MLVMKTFENEFCIAIQPCKLFILYYHVLCARAIPTYRVQTMHMLIHYVSIPIGTLLWKAGKLMISTYG